VLIGLIIYQYHSKKKEIIGEELIAEKDMMILESNG